MSIKTVTTTPLSLKEEKALLDHDFGSLSSYFEAEVEKNTTPAVIRERLEEFNMNLKSFEMRLQQKVDDTKNILAAKGQFVNREVHSRAVMEKLGSDASYVLGNILMDEECEINTRLEAVYLLGKRTPAKESVPILISMLQREGGQLKYTVLKSLQDIGREAHEAVPVISEYLSGESRELREQAVETLGAIGPAAQSCVTTLVDMLNFADRLRQYQTRIIHALAGIGPVAKVMPALLSALCCGVEEVETETAKALGTLGEEAENAVPLLIAALNRRSNDVNHAAAEALARIGPKAERAIPDLVTAFAYPVTESIIFADKNVRAAASNALTSIGEAALPALAAGLTSKTESIRTWSAVTMTNFAGPKLGQFLPELILALEDKNTHVLRNVCYVLGSIGKDASSAVTQMLKHLSSESLEVRENVAIALGQIGDKSAIASLKACLNSERESARVHGEITTALQKLQEGSES